MTTSYRSKWLINLMLAGLLLALGSGINATYHRYAETGLSSLPQPPVQSRYLDATTGSVGSISNIHLSGYAHATGGAQTIPGTQESEGPMTTFPLRGIKDSPPYMHGGRCPNPYDAVEFFNVVLELDLSNQEKEDLVAYLLTL